MVVINEGDYKTSCDARLKPRFRFNLGMLDSMNEYGNKEFTG